MGAIGVRARQFVILFRKNWLLTKRNRRASLLQILVPFIFVLLLFLLQFGLEANARLSVQAKDIPVPSNDAIGSIPRCIPQIKGGSCYTFAWTSNDNATVFPIVERVRTKNNIPPSEVKFLPSEIDLDDFLFQNLNTTQGAFVLNYTLANGTNVYDLTLQINQTDVYDQNLNKIEFVNYVQVPMQLSIEREIARQILMDGPQSMAENDPGFIFQVNTRPFARPPLRTIDVISNNGPAFFFAALMFNFVIQLGQIVSEKELKLRDYMNIMGLKASVYWFSWWVTNTILNTISALILIVSGYIFQFNFFLKNDFGTFFLSFMLFAWALVPFTFFISTFLRESRSATIFGFVIFLIGVIIQGFATTAFTEDFSAIARVIFSLLPFVLLSKCIGDLGAASNGATAKGLRMSEITTNAWFPLSRVFLWYLIDFLVYFVLTIYLDNVLPDVNGVRKPIYFFVLPSYWFGERPEQKRSPQELQSDLTRALNKRKNEEEKHSIHVDTDVEKERMNVINSNLPESTAVKVMNLTKSYQQRRFGCFPNGKFHAVKGTFFHIDAGSLFCLLGHNGAGKTTTINMLIGLYPPTDGDAEIFGYSIRTEIDSIRKIMGVCPQHDILWDELTGEEHLEFFAALKGLPREKIAEEVEERLKDVELTSSAKLASVAYSGGMKRRLSTAIALTGNPQIVFLDEPTTGMDPVSRRQVWNLIERVKRDRVIVLTTHSMEEADILGDRIVIMKQGRLECAGTSLHLKNKFGAGYRVTILHEPNTKQKVIEFFKEKLKLDPAGGGDNFVEYNIPRPDLPKLPEFFSDLELHAEKLHISDIQLSMTTLEEVFLKIAEDEEAKVEIIEETAKKNSLH